MKTKMFFVSLLFASPFAISADMTQAQRTTFAAAINAETNETVVACRAIRNDTCLANWYNAAFAPTTKAWRKSVSSTDLFDTTDLTVFDSLTAGKREAYRLIIDFAPVDFSRTKIRNAISDIWPATQRDAILNSATENASRFEMVFGGSSATTGGVTAIRRNVFGPVTVNDVSISLNGQ